MNKVSFSRPRDKSLQAFKDWIENLVKRINPNAPEGDTSEEEWIEDWKKFWSKAGNDSDTQESNEE